MSSLEKREKAALIHIHNELQQIDNEFQELFEDYNQMRKQKE